MIAENIRAEILRRIAAAEAQHDVRILLAVESGSRAWGFASPNSDFDARFIYAHPRDWYLSVSLEEKRDVIEYPIVDDIDLNGWYVRKALRLFRKSNPAFVEWIQSPIVYLQRGPFAERVRDLLPRLYSCVNGVHHYRSMAKRNYRGYLQSDRVPLKKYFYVLRPLLSVRWIERYNAPPPLEFERLLELIAAEKSLLSDIHALLAMKRSSPELGKAAPVASIDRYIVAELDRISVSTSKVQDRRDFWQALDHVFHASLN
jgi:uncharacterized protein